MKTKKLNQFVVRMVSEPRYDGWPLSEIESPMVERAMARSAGLEAEYFVWLRFAITDWLEYGHLLVTGLIDEYEHYRREPERSFFLPKAQIVVGGQRQVGWTAKDSDTQNSTPWYKLRSHPLYGLYKPFKYMEEYFPENVEESDVLEKLARYEQRWGWKWCSMGYQGGDQLRVMFRKVA